MRVSLRRGSLRVLVGAGLVLSLLGPAGCGPVDPSPEETARAFIAAVRSRDPAAVLEYLDASTREYLERMAELATDRVGGRRVIEPVELLQVVSVDPDFDVAAARRLDTSTERTKVELTAPDGEIEVVELVREDERWRVALPALRDPGAGVPLGPSKG